MNGSNTVLKQLKYVIITFFLVLICTITHIQATDLNIDTENENNTDLSTNLPYIEMKVKAVKVGESNQILVECWGSNFTNLEGVEIVFTYDNTKLTPSYISGDNKNEELSGLESIKYDKRPAETESEEVQAAFLIASKNLLSNSFEFDSAYTDLLGIDIFKYKAQEGNNEALQFVISRKDPLQEVSAEEPVLLGTFSFKQTENTTIEENEFVTKRIKIYCNDYEDTYSREVAAGEDCTEILEWTYENYGSISGTIEANINTGSKTIYSKNITTIKIYKKSDINEVDFSNIEYFKSLPEPLIEYTTTEEENGVFKIENIEFGQYVVIFDKEYYGDYIIDNLTIDSENKDINFLDIECVGIINLIPGDINKDGRIDSNDTLLYNKDLKTDKIIDFNDATSRGYNNDSNDILMYNAAYKQYEYRTTKKEVKTIINCLDYV